MSAALKRRDARRDQLAEYAQHRVERAGCQLLNIASILQIISLEDNGADAISSDLVEFLGDLIAERAQLIIDEGNVSANFVKDQRWGGSKSLPAQPEDEA